MRRIITAGMLGASLATAPAIVACTPSDETVEVAEYEDCDVEDQGKKEDDCGYWRHPNTGAVYVGSQPDPSWIWVWYAWVIVGQHSLAPRGWTPPAGVKPPVRTVRMPKSKVCAMGITNVFVARPGAPAPAPPRPANPVPRVNNPAPPAPKNPAPKAPAPKIPGQRPAGC